MNADTAWYDHPQRGCAGQPDLMFPEIKRGDNRYNMSLLDELAAICFQCPVQQECLEEAETHDTRAGMWGGVWYGGSHKANGRQWKKQRLHVEAARQGIHYPYLRVKLSA